ncbi:MAG: hypothetical protein IKR81_00835, partial [Victivallales bacterium]|nr:hypothetical protein [Victivallales bacterium]
GGGSSWMGGAAEGESVFEILAGLKWNGLGDNSDNEVRGVNIMQTTNQAGKSINSLTELQKLKIY